MSPTKAVEFGLVIQPDGWFELADWTPNTTPAATLGCDLTHPIPLSREITLWVDEDALMNGRPVNAPATPVLRSLGAIQFPYFGAVLLTGPTDHDTACEANGLREDQALALIEQYLTRAAVKVPQQRTC
ncbi:DUF3846 domain-containing protein [Streptomyces polychromogenes]|uniref:DUF3846 domain-containing protein n=1 Tax=Streptomyces polychromogenes TaxID=67342 RepID=A0ABN0V199_9ACTN